MTCYLIRHGKTQSNIERRYSGCNTDESLSPEYTDDLKPAGPCAGHMLFISPMKRTAETAEIMFPGMEAEVIRDLREMDFGIFEGKNHSELDGDPDYQEWIDSMGMSSIPEGECLDCFRERTMNGFRKAVCIAAVRNVPVIYIVAHGGTVMSVMSSLFGGNYYDYYSDNGQGYVLELEVDDAGNIVAAGAYDRFCGGIRA